ncbi:gamma-glutamyltranspeptidase [Streptomyces sp. LBUM 1478]|uniref:gamma-glutamyltransferase family protein n=1 Tax=Streptomyces scabiei TaxID=1930 RepID=UPI001B30144F|nr:MULTISPECIES: gamma-glutamyltransferase [Streptomyces]MBP5860076.1 gamma-glutamyltranspeptidase [Streptomyces sp. LBUM 1484]MBP5871083.1 gamma-glutamyltranspeptidase [Streptomyces sp. LBUM 1485]MBP5908905.1 gamma-glutamyltranspeptidase [Streptomyces sp. LBUM 1478]MBP5927498.1 gamma-glutamyltranspeptidase [Streptomyces sp. LBUM 1479]MBP5879611.1 gamma-glutamyltranspeptidase [Streptomyces sp. LBUM 1477]
MSVLTERRLSASGGEWAVATPHSTASDVAADVLRGGGNAVDAALAAAAMLTVVYPNQCSVGGDLLALVGTADGEVRFVNAGGRAPRAVDVRELTDRYERMPVLGALPVTVPGAVAGWAALAEAWGTRPLAAALAPAEAAAREGVPVAPGLALDLRRERPILARDPGMLGVFFADGDVLGAGRTLRQPALARTLASIAAQGPSALYGGDVGLSLVKLLARHGSAMTAEDLAEHRVRLSETHGAVYDGVEYLSGGDNSQGLYFLQGMRALDVVRSVRGTLDPLGRDAGVVASVLAQAAADRDSFCCDPEWEEATPAEELLSAPYVRRVAERAMAGTPVELLGRPKASGDTVAVVVTDRDGTWVSLIQSVFHCFGAGLLDPGTGVVLHNRGASFSLDPTSPNRLAGGKRPLHTLMPVLVRETGTLVGAHGVMGGRAQPQVHTHLALQLAAGASPGRAVSAPRWVLGAMEAGVTEGAGTVKAERDVPGAGVGAIEGAGFAVDLIGTHDDGVGHGQLVRRADDAAGPRLLAATDPRADGSAVAG